MESIISDLVKLFEKGKVSRRELIGSLTILATAGGAASVADAQEAPFRSTRIDHISIQVADLRRSIDFYEKVFGLSVLSGDTDNEIARMGTTRILVSLHRRPPTGIVDHYAIAIDEFDTESATRTLTQLGLTPEQNLDYGFHVRDPEGMPVQIVGT